MDVAEDFMADSVQWKASSLGAISQIVSDVECVGTDARRRVQQSHKEDSIASSLASSYPHGAARRTYMFQAVG
jgi:hypothetical protein